MDSIPAPLEAFLEYGHVPFAGRTNVIERITSFRESIPFSDGLRLVLISGEAGLGKSRLIDEATPLLKERGGVVIRIRFLPVASSGPIAMIGRAVALDESLHPLIGGHPLTDAADVVAALSRLSRLRATLLVLDDAHLLSPPAPSELLRLFESLSQECLAVLALARPVEGPHRAVMERYLTDQIGLPGLSALEVASIWKAIFGHDAETDIVDALHEATGGNPLSIRSVLRGAITSGAIVRRGDRYRLAVDRNRFVNEARRDLSRLGEGMAAHLDADERRAAELLAALGEVFARETAQALLGEENGLLLDRLVARGILSNANVQAVPLPGLSRDIPDHPGSLHPPFVFSHSLLHQHLLRVSSPPVDRLARMVASGLPLYSTIPMSAIDEHLGSLPDLDPDVARRLHDRIRFAAIDTLDFDPSRLRPLLEISRHVAERFGGHWSQDGRRETEFGLLATELAALGHEGRWEEYDAAADRLLAMTDDPASEREASMRIGAIGKKNLALLSDAANRRKIWEEMEGLVARFPGVVRSHNYAMMVTALSIVAGFANDPDFAHDVERRLAAIDEAWSDDPVSRFLHHCVDPGLLMVFGSREELEQRLNLFERLETESFDRGERIVFIEKGLQFLELVGDVDRLLTFAERHLPYLHRELNPHQRAAALLARLKWMGATGADVDELLDAGAGIVSAMPVDDQPAGRGYLYSGMAGIALLRGDHAKARTMLEANPDGLDLLRPSVRMLAEMEATSPPVLHPPLYVDDDPVVSGAIRCFVAFDTADEVDGAGVVQAVRMLAERGTLSLPDVLLHRLLARFLTRRRFADMETSLGAAMKRWTEETVEWLSVRRLGDYLDATLKAGGSWLDPKRVKEEKGRVARIRRERSVELAERQGRGRMTVRMIGTIAVVDDMMRERKSGGRMKTLLGLMAGLELDVKPMDHKDFCTLAAGDDDLDRARNVVYVTLHRLREVLGQDAIITETDLAPRFNPRIVRVDVVDAHRAIVSGMKALRAGNVIHAVAMVEKSLDTLRSDVPFPGLYEDYFEEARYRIETSLRDLILRLGKRLVAERDFEQSDMLLRRALEAMPEDEELEELRGESRAVRH